MATYRGWYSTKLGLALIAMVLLFLAFACTGFADSLFSDFCLALVGLAGAHHAASVVEKATSKSDAP